VTNNLYVVRVVTWVLV